MKEEATMLQVFSFDSKPDITGLAKMFPFDNKCCISCAIVGLNCIDFDMRVVLSCVVRILLIYTSCIEFHELC